MTTGTEKQDPYSAAEAIDAMLEADDGALLAAMARYKASLLELFGREGIVKILQAAVDGAPHVEYFSRRSRREIDSSRPEVNLRVNHILALAENEALKAQWGTRSVDNVTEQEMLALKAAVIHEEVCIAMATTMNEALAPHWTKAKSYVETLKKDSSANLKMMLCTLFSVRVGSDPAIAPADRMCTLLVFI